MNDCTGAPLANIIVQQSRVGMENPSPKKLTHLFFSKEFSKYVVIEKG